MSIFNLLKRIKSKIFLKSRSQLTSKLFKLSAVLLYLHILKADQLDLSASLSTNDYTLVLNRMDEILP